MRLDVEIAGRLRHVEVTRADGRFECRIDGRIIEADVSEVSRGTYSFLIGGHPIEVHVNARGQGLHIYSGQREFIANVRDPRKYHKGGGAVLVEGRQSVTAPMPGKVISVLVRTGDIVSAGQGIVVVEAMKMQNEVKSPKSGKIEKMLAGVGQAVNAGDVLAVVG